MFKFRDLFRNGKTWLVNFTGFPQWKWKQISLMDYYFTIARRLIKWVLIIYLFSNLYWFARYFLLPVSLFCDLMWIRVNDTLCWHTFALWIGVLFFDWLLFWFETHSGYQYLRSLCLLCIHTTHFWFELVCYLWSSIDFSFEVRHSIMQYLRISLWLILQVDYISNCVQLCKVSYCCYWISLVLLFMSTKPGKMEKLEQTFRTNTTQIRYHMW